MLYFTNVTRFRKWKLVMILVLLCLASCSKILLKTLRGTVAQLTDLQRCPACFGLSLCDAILNDKIHFNHKNAYATFASLFEIKNVFYADYQGARVVLKKLAHTSELDAFDKMLCSNRMLADLCPNGSGEKIVPSSVDFRTRIGEEITTDFASRNASSLRLCPSAEHMDDLLYNVYANSGNERKQISHAYLWTMIKVNPEPLVLQSHFILGVDRAARIVSQSTRYTRSTERPERSLYKACLKQILPAKEGWPVARYLGACGRLVVEEYVGPTLTNYHREPWSRRAKIASSLLEAARMLTYRDPRFGFYLTDISPDNIAIDEADDAKFIDMENIIIVDKRSFKHNGTAGRNDLEVNDLDFDCENCLVFSPTDICNRRHSDHNYYAVCQHILAQSSSSASIPGGLLHDVPNDVLLRYPNLSSLLRECAVPGGTRTRIVVGNLLIELLNEIVANNARN